MYRRLALCCLLIGALFLATAADADARIFGRKRFSRSYTNHRPTVSRSRGYVVRGPSPFRIHVSPARYRYLKTFYPTMVRRVR